ncbi:hypothetical protein MYCTH_92700 [Thermothelomyces thermophilus ATCC 42464]|uniref:Uncharacterized protein n=1 Tax=Thermothelomyces thermophilus (strain ATCC 42464 / BCRC 31852 / DSM 1799) TaxID=573729 RepID=G2QA30_THET4|nr:uncharacterized protein MYCTH_92700 [Thermothelomyces thermophilus ATCC 42464]AEO56634.1 hypothetical protein MYCTH_92700 [Thermothelomyces thermophilus ATCC 42464]
MTIFTYRFALEGTRCQAHPRVSTAQYELFCSANPWDPAGYGGIDGAENPIVRGGCRMTIRYFGFFCADNKVVGSGHIFCFECRGLGRIRIRDRVSPLPQRPPASRENRKPLPQFKAVAWPDRIRQPSAVPPMIAWFAQHGIPTGTQPTHACHDPG